ncbi:hypothetical protein F2P45_31060 [Massilia sp. CCM 8733]|uniref:Uncharacterized protein n=1 Tax=Massilia mucilaginosa TaxID=2609282 RepID=A0ABX0P2E9_9BURK|nr:hypothetical protein [Massilia mucilaginosa]NHZ93415.1 hypothetical protein [Massilia mucilaginosa]
MQIVAAGLCCSLGYHLDAVVSAIRANIDHFQASNFYAKSSIPVNVAMLSDDVYGDERLSRWITFAIRDCIIQIPNEISLFDTKRTAIVVLGPDKSRPHSNSGELIELIHNIMLRLHAYTDPDNAEKVTRNERHRITSIMQSRTGLVDGLLQAASYLVNEETDQVLLIGVDSYLNSADMNKFISDPRLIISGNSDGFIPGEAAAALLLHRSSPDAPGLHIKGVGKGKEVGRYDGSVPCRSQGLSNALRAACNQAKVVPSQIEFHMSDQNGEQFYAKDIANAVTRVMFGGKKLSHLTLADKIGEVGSAAGPAMLAWLQRDMSDPVFSPGDTGIVHLANDDGTRCAVVLR